MQTLEFLTVFCVGSDFKPHTKRKNSGFPKLLGFRKQHLFSFCALGQRCKREREREREREVVGEDVVGWWAGGFAGSSHAASI